MPELFLVETPATNTLPTAQPGVLPDVLERKQALDIRASWIVEAPAGSGKTGLLIQRYLKLLADESIESPEQILAITFTRKATAEMRERVLAQLQAASSGDEPVNAFARDTRPLAQAVLARNQALNWQLLDQPARLNIRTIDSVCSDIASSLPLLSGSGGRRRTVDDALPLYLTAARSTFMQLGGQDPELDQALRLVLLHRDGNLPECERLLAGMLEHREQWGELVPLGPHRLDDTWLDTNVLPRLELALEQAVCAALTQLTRTIPAHVLSQLTSAAAEMAHIAGYRGAASPIAICAGRHTTPQDKAEDLDHWRALVHLLRTPSTQSWRKVFSANIVKFEISKPEQAHLKSLVEQLHHRDDLLRAICNLGTLPPAKYPQEQWVVAKALFRILNRALAELQLVFAERGECDFAEPALAARTALRHDDGARDLESASSIHLQHLLVDEMQDTSSSQYELIQMLTHRWDGHSQTVFLVGDPKQSIYLFRQARVERFLRTMRTQQLGDLPLGCIRLTANFRSQASLVAEFNEDFASIFPSAINAQHPEEVPFVKASAIRPSNPTSNGRVWHANVLPTIDPVSDAKSRKRQYKSDAAEIRTIVEDWQSRPLPGDRKEAWKIAVLVRSRSHLDEIVAAFKGTANLNGHHSERTEESPDSVLTGQQPHSQTPIPYRAVDIEPLETRPEVQDLFALTRALLHPADRTAWLAVLHAPWCGLSLAELHIITGADDPALAQRTILQLIADRGDLLHADALVRLERIWPVLSAAVLAIGRLPFAQTVERTWRSLGGDTYLNASERTNTHRYLQLLDELSDRSSTFDLAALERKMTKLFAAPIIHTGAVDLLTMHAAKGLEWDVVIVPALDRTTGRNRSRLLTWVELDGPAQHHDAAHVLLAPITGKGEASTELNTWIASIHNAREDAERKRLFYVACTRAREELHLFASPVLSAKGDLKPRSGSLLASAWPAAEPCFAPALTPQAIDSHSLEQEEETFAIAASAPEHLPGTPSVAAPGDGSDTNIARALEHPATLKRLPLDFDPTARLRSSRPIHIGKTEEGPAASHFERPQGSFAARAFGNTVHAFLERITQQLATGITAPTILNTLPSWTSRIAAALRSEGLQPAVVERLAQRVLHALDLTLKDPHGLWLLSPHPGAATEYALTAWTGQRTAIRVDRIFRAGPEPNPSRPDASQSDHLWIVDYKTTTHGTEGLDAFLTTERARYAPQLESYARVFQQINSSQEECGGQEENGQQQQKGEPQIRLALYYPMLSKLIWWTP